MLLLPLQPNLSLTIQFTNEIFFKLVGKVTGKKSTPPTSPNTKKEKYVKILIIIYVLCYFVLSAAKKPKKLQETFAQTLMGHAPERKKIICK